VKQVRKIITSESVNIGHPDKTCDVIADAFLDAALSQDPHAQMAVECAIKDDLLMIYGEATTSAKIDYEQIAKEVLREVGYTCEFKIIKKISEQSPQINKAVVKKELAANDQGIVYGYACDETPELMPLPIMLAHKLMQRYESWRKEYNGRMESSPTSRFYSDAKSQVSVEYENDKPIGVHTVLVSVSHAEGLDNKTIVKLIRENVIDPVLTAKNYIINPSGAFSIWGSFSDSGCVGRKIVVDTYGGVGRVGGGAFSSKNATKIDRSGAYYARYVAKNIVAKGIAKTVEVSASYAIGLSYPIKVNIDTFGTGDDVEVSKWVQKNFDFSPANMIKELDLLKPIYKKTACYGHFGRECEEFAWEKIK